jgi:DNA-binding IclR family transcriptional regulator
LSSEILFETLKDGAWHSLTELSDQLGVPIDKLIEYACLLSKQGMVKFEENTQRIKILPEWKILLPDETQLMKENKK